MALAVTAAVKRVVTHRLRGKLLVSAAVVFGSAIALLAGSAPAGAGQRPGQALVASITISPESALPATAHAAGTPLCLPRVDGLDRTASCERSVITITFFENMVPVGEQQADLIQSIHLNAHGKTWVEFDTFTNVVSMGTTGQTAVDLEASCDSPCHAVAHFAGRLVPGLSGAVHYTVNVARNQVHETFTHYKLVYDSPPFVPLNVLTWESSFSYRCDNGLSASDTGCVFPAFTPTLVLPVSRFGASATMMEWAQHNLPGHWGLRGVGSELRRLADKIKAKDNRDKICDKTFVNMGSAIGEPFDKDSCDEFPFAATNQGGGTTGAACAQVHAVRITRKGTEAQQWSAIRVIDPAPSAPCVRGHIPLKENNATGGAYGALIKNQRLINDDPFWVSVVK